MLVNSLLDRFEVLLLVVVVVTVVAAAVVAAAVVSVVAAAVVTVVAAAVVGWQIVIESEQLRLTWHCLVDSVLSSSKLHSLLLVVPLERPKASTVIQPGSVPLKLRNHRL